MIPPFPAILVIHNRFYLIFLKYAIFSHFFKDDSILCLCRVKSCSVLKFPI